MVCWGAAIATGVGGKLEQHLGQPLPYIVPPPFLLQAATMLKKLESSSCASAPRLHDA